MITDYHAKLYAHELLRRCPSDSVERFTAALMDSQVDLNPHQVDAALFAFRSPLSKGAILADEVGLGKTIEAGIVLSQKWAERKRKILIILPSSLRKQWNQELIDKFYLPSKVLEATTFNKALKAGTINPFESDKIILCSYQFARNKSEYLNAIQWDLVVVDEAHRLRNVYKTSNKIAREIKSAVQHAPKLLLTATPLQNSLLELFGLVSFIDEHIFGDLKSFKSQFARLSNDDNFIDLKQRLQLVCKRTLRRQVLEYIRYTHRKAYTQEFVPSAEENALYDLVSEYLQRPNLQALPASQRSLMTLVLRKLLASSTFAIAGSLESLAKKLEKKLKDDLHGANADKDIEDDYELYDELVESSDFEEETFIPLTPEERALMQKEIEELRAFFDLAMRISENTKGLALLDALRIGFGMASELGSAEKAIIFTESRRTQNYLVELLSNNGYAEDLVLFNGSNSDSHSKQVYANWKEQYQGTDRISGSRTADTRAALVDHFKHKAKIMIATEAAAEGINLQFCSMVVNYDLPWNPQRIEQRIGRCHRYGQMHDVVVINFLNKSNAADQRVFELLSEKFQLFNGVFGASDEVLGSIESGVDFEKRVSEIYQTCREPEEIKKSFDALQDELSIEIQANMQSTRQKLLDHFDAEVAEKLNVYKAEATASINKYEALLWETTHYVLHQSAEFNHEQLTFHLPKVPDKVQAPSGVYTLKRQDDIGHHYRIQHTLAQNILNTAAQASTLEAKLVFDYSGNNQNISILKEIVGKSGSLMVTLLTVNALDAEDYIICVALVNEGEALDSEQARSLFKLPAQTSREAVLGENVDQLKELYNKRSKEILADISQRNASFFEEEMDKLERWATDQKRSLEIKIKDRDTEIKQTKADARKVVSLEDKLAIQRKAKKLEKKRTEMRRRLFEAQDEVDSQKEELLDSVEARLQQTVEEKVLFRINWAVI